MWKSDKDRLKVPPEVTCQASGVKRGCGAGKAKGQRSRNLPNLSSIIGSTLIATLSHRIRALEEPAKAS